MYLSDIFIFPFLLLFFFTVLYWTVATVGAVVDLWCVCACVFTSLWYLLCFHFAGFDSTMSWAVGEWALESQLHVFFYVCLKSCRGKYLRGVLSIHRLNIDLVGKGCFALHFEPFSCAVCNPWWFTISHRFSVLLKDIILMRCQLQESCKILPP